MLLIIGLVGFVAAIILFVESWYVVKDHEVHDLNASINTYEQVCGFLVTYEVVEDLFRSKNIKLLPSSPEEREELARSDPDGTELYFDSALCRVVRRPLCQAEQEAMRYMDGFSGLNG